MNSWILQYIHNNKEQYFRMYVHEFFYSNCIYSQYFIFNIYFQIQKYIFIFYIHTYTHIQVYFFSLSAKCSRANDTPAAVSTLSTQIVVSKS